MNSPVIAEATRWSEIPAVIEEYLKSAGNEPRSILGYGSLIWNHSGIKPAGCKSAQYDNIQATVKGASVDMNLYAAGPDEFRGSSTSTGLYIGMTPTGDDNDITHGLNIKIDTTEFPSAVLSFFGQELGIAPAGIDVNKLFTEKFGVSKDAAKEFAKAKGTAADDLKLYTFQIVKTQENGKDVLSLVVSANTKSQFYTNNIDPLTAAAHIVDGRGYARNNGTGRSGGTALDYFSNQIKGFRERKIFHPKLEAIAEQVYKIGAFYAKASAALSDDGKSDDAKRMDELLSEAPVTNINGVSTSSFRSRYFAKGTAFVDRPKVSAEEIDTQKMPVLAIDKIKDLTRKFLKGNLDFLAPNSAKAIALG